MNPRIPMGGFIVRKSQNFENAEFIQGLKNKGFETVSFCKDGVVLASVKEYEGQGIWSNGAAGVAYDVDLINEARLRKMVGVGEKEALDIGDLIWRLYRRFRLDFIDKLRGAFGFSLWDPHTRSLLVVTDPFGIRPVVYAEKADRLLAASRMRMLIVDKEISREIKPDAIYHYLFFSAICSPLTIFKGIEKLEPGKLLLHQGGKTEVICHYDIEYKPDGCIDESKWLKAIPEAVQKAVGRFVSLSSDRKTGCFLSGGTDSSSVAGYYTRISGHPARTFSIGFDDPKYNEMDFARIAAERFGTEHHEYFVTPSDVLELVNALSEIYDEPFGNASVVPAYYCSSLAKGSGVEVLLGGDGGDEIFGGNERYVTNLVFERYHHMPENFRKKVFERILEALPSKGLLYKAKRYVRRANIPNPERFFSYNLLSETDIEKVFLSDFLQCIDIDCFSEIARKHFERNSNAHVTDRLLYLDMKFTITDNDLRKVTQMVEAAGIRVRYPLLDRELVDFTATIPPELKVKPGKNRYIFKRAMEGFLPDRIINKEKHGMGMPIAKWFKYDKELNELLYDTLFSGIPRIGEFIRPDFLGSIRESFMSDDTTAYYGDSLWVYLILELWLKKLPGSNLF